MITLLRRWLPVLCLLLLTTFTLHAQPDPEEIAGHTGPPPAGVDGLAFIVGDWAFTSVRDLSTYNFSNPGGEDTVLSEAEGVIRIDHHLDGHAYLGEYVTAMDATRVEGTLFWGLTDSTYEPWDMAWVESGFDRIMTFGGTIAEGEDFTGNAFIGMVEIITTITPVDEDAFTLTITAESGRIGERTMWQAEFTRIDAGEAITGMDALRAAYELPAEPEGIHQFDFFIGAFDLVSIMRSRDNERLPAFNTIRWINGGHAFIEHWVALWDEQPFEATAITTYDPDTGLFHNMWWQTGTSRIGKFSSLGCEGEGEDYSCKIAGFFNDISDAGFIWSSSATPEASGWIMEFTRVDEAASGS